MAQKRNPVSLRLQTRLQGNEKRFASCWFTDSFFSTVYADDLVKRLYLGHLLQKAGSWYGEVSESRIPETCISIQFLYRKCSILCVALDRRKEEYIFSNSAKNVKTRADSSPTFSRQEGMTPCIASRAEITKIPLYSKKKDAFLSIDNVASTQIFACERDKLPDLSKHTGGACLPSAERDVSVEQMAYLSIANCLQSIAAKNMCRVAVSHKEYNGKLADSMVEFSHRSKKIVDDTGKQTDEKQTSWRTSLNQLAPRRDASTWLNQRKAYQEKNMIPDSVYFSAIESICDSSRRDKQIQAFSSTRTVREGDHSELDLVSLLVACKVERQAKPIIPLIPAYNWTSCALVRGVSACQNIEFCLYSVAFLYKKRLSFLQIKETLFRMLASSGSVRGARLVCSGRQGGRSKSAMRAKKQSALWGQSALSLFSSRLAFASTGVDTSFGQIGIKIWICYK